MAKERVSLVFRASRYFLYLWLKLFHRFEIHGQENVPMTGACILAANHVSYLDPPVVGAGFRKRPVRFMARDTLAKSRFMRWYFRTLHCVLIDRTRGDVAALKQGLRVLKDGEILGVFPEGTRSLDGELKEPKGGIGFMITKASVPVIPVYVDGTYQSLPKNAQGYRMNKVRVFYGKAISPEELQALGSGRDVYDKAAELVMSRIAAMKAEYADK